MIGKACPTCRSTSFYVKNPRDAWEVFEFRVGEDGIVFEPDEDGREPPAVGETTETHCARCSWHGRFGTL